MKKTWLPVVVYPNARCIECLVIRHFTINLSHSCHMSVNIPFTFHLGYVPSKLPNSRSETVQLRRRCCCFFVPFPYVLPCKSWPFQGWNRGLLWLDYKVSPYQALSVINGVISARINGRKYMGNWGVFHPYKWSDMGPYNCFLGPPCTNDL